MIRIFKKSKVHIMAVLCLGCLLFGLTTVNLSVFAKEKSTYYIKVNKSQNCVTVYQQDENGEYTVPVKAMTCSSGVATPLGIFNTKEKYRWKLLMGDVWGQYSTRIEKGVLFHSVWYYKMDASTLSAKQYNKLGTTASHGCIRLTVADAKWIYDNCSIGTTVEVYNGKDPGPLGKPETLAVPSGSGWDPTDPSKDNPYNQNIPVIKGVSNKVIEWGTDINLRKGVTALSTAGTDITSKLTVKGKVDIYTAGKYNITYSITDAIGKSVEKDMIVTVKKCMSKPTFEGITDHSISSETVVDREFALNGVTAYLATKKLSQKEIKVKITKDSDNTYAINYSITGENGLTGTATAVAYIDTTPPVMEGVTHKELTLEQISAGRDRIKKIALQDITVKDDFSKLSVKNVKVYLEAVSDYAYLVTYKATDNAGNSSIETVQFTYFKDIKISGVSNHHNIPYGTQITEEYVKQGVSASDSTGDCTSKMQIAIGKNVGEEYVVTYSVTDEKMNTVAIEAYYTVDAKPAVAETTDPNTSSDLEAVPNTSNTPDGTTGDEKPGTENQGTENQGTENSGTNGKQ